MRQETPNLWGFEGSVSKKKFKVFFFLKTTLNTKHLIFYLFKLGMK